MQFYFPGAQFSSIASNVAGFSSAIQGAVIAIVGSPTYGSINVTVNQTSTGGIFVKVSVPYLSLQTILGAAVSASQLSFTFLGQSFRGAFNANYGLCATGSVSPNGYSPGCFTCPANTFVSRIAMCNEISLNLSSSSQANHAQTICEPCPSQTTSTPGSYDVSQCIPVSVGRLLNLVYLLATFLHLPSLASYNPFNFGEMWTGTYSLTVNGALYQGSATFEVTMINGANVQLLGTFTHGTYCAVASGCRTPGVSAYYLTGTVSGNTLVAQPTAWAAITDTTFPPQSITGILSTSGQTTTFSGYLGSGTFTTTLACSAAVGLLDLFSFFFAMLTSITPSR